MPGKLLDGSFHHWISIEILILRLVVIQQHDAKFFGCSREQQTTTIQGVGCGFIIGISDRGYALVGGGKPPCWWKAHEVSRTLEIHTYVLADCRYTQNQRGISLNRHGPQAVALNNFQIDTTSLEVRERTIINKETGLIRKKLR